jgi:cysteine desulfurase
MATRDSDQAISINFDNAATTASDPAVDAAIRDSLIAYPGNPGSSHRLGREAKARLESKRECFAEIIGAAAPTNVIFTASGTEASNLAIYGLHRQRPIRHLISATSEHSSVYNCVNRLAREGVEITLVSPDKNGAIHPAAVFASLTDDTDLVSIMHVNSETGVINPLTEIAAGLPENVVFHSDMVQSLAKVDIDLAKLPVDMASFAGHKIHGPKGIGALYLRSGTPLKKIMEGGGQEFDLRPGTENLAAVEGFVTALQVYEGSERIAAMREVFERRLRKALPKVRIHGEKSPRAPHISNILFPDVAGEGLLIRLDRAGLFASLGSACASGSINPSRVLLAMGLARSEALSSLRFSFGRFNQMEEVDKAIAIIVEQVQKWLH